MKKAKRKPYQLLIILILLFAIPLYLAIWLYNNDFSLGNKTINHGALILPPVSTHELGVPNTHKWTLILLAPKRCANACQEKLFKMRQIQKASGKNKQRIQRMLITYQSTKYAFRLTKRLYPHLQIIQIPKKNLKKITNTHQSVLFAKHANTIFIADPNGNVMMAYKPKTNPMNIFKDLKHLLRLSQIG